MALHYDLSKVAHPLPDEDQTTTDMIFATMAVGLGDITEANAKEFHTRLVMLGYDTSLGTVQRYVGLHTNVSPMTDAAFNRHIVKVLRGRASDARWRESYSAPSPVSLD